MDKLAMTITKVLTAQPTCFSIRGERYALHPPTLGVVFVTAPLLEDLQIRREAITENPIYEALRVVKFHRGTCCRLLAYHTLRGKKLLTSQSAIDKRSASIEEFNDEDIATLLLAVLNDNSVDEIVKGTEMDKEAREMSKVNKAKDSKNSLTFGGKSVWGNLVDVACERYGWTLDYVLWGISYANLVLLLKDKITSVYMSDTELKKAHLSDRSGERVSGDDKEAVMRAIRNNTI